MNLRKTAPTVVLVVLAVFTTAFAFINYGNTVKVWPLVGAQHLTLVIGVAFLLGAGVGGLLGHLLRNGRSIKPGMGTPAGSDNRERAHRI